NHPFFFIYLTLAISWLPIDVVSYESAILKKHFLTVRILKINYKMENLENNQFYLIKKREENYEK
ncbi:MAG: hypothetical protein WC337_05640, partial [Candidatus Muiribacteriota bacterium]